MGGERERESTTHTNMALYCIELKMKSIVASVINQEPLIH